jgi:periplasmic protein CpxP/Spy
MRPCGFAALRPHFTKLYLRNNCRLPTAGKLSSCSSQTSKGLIMTTSSTPDVARPLRGLLFNRYTLAAFALGAALAAGVGASAYGMSACSHGMMMGGAHSAADVSAHVDHALKHLYVEIDASPAQKAQIDPLVKQAVNDLMPLHAQIQAAHSRAMQALTQATIDRNALETARAEHLQLADQASRRIVQLIADVGDVLSVQQRKGLADHLERMHASPMGEMPHS